MPRIKKVQPPFKFLYENKLYSLKVPYDGQRTKFIISDGTVGKVLTIVQWQIGSPMIAIPDHVETFDLSEMDQRLSSIGQNFFVAELVA